MGEYLDQIPVQIRDHIRQITKSSGLPDVEESIEMIARGWLEKKGLFEAQVQSLGMEEVDELAGDEERGALVMTFSGSLLNIGPLREEGRNVQYASIGLRQDVPETAEREGSRLSAELRCGEPARFSPGPIASSSPVFKIAVTSAELGVEEQEQVITKATQILTQEFVDVNRELEAE